MPKSKKAYWTKKIQSNTKRDKQNEALLTNTRVQGHGHLGASIERYQFIRLKFNMMVVKMGVKFTFIDLFAGIGGIGIPLKKWEANASFLRNGIIYAQVTYEANFGERPMGDITKISAESIPDHDVLLAGFPCQPFSIIGKGQGFAV